MQRPGRVRPPWRSSVSWPLRVQKVDSIQLADRSERAVAARFVFAVGSQEACAEAGHLFFELGASEAFVGDDGVAVQVDAFR